MKKVITYGTFDLLHFGHIRLLERAKALGDYLIVGVTADDFDIARGKLNVHQPLIERIEAVRSTGLADEIIVEEYEGQKIDDVRRYDVDVFAIGSDWTGKFDYLNEYCDVVYLERTKGVSSTQLREEYGKIRMGYVGESHILLKYIRESTFIEGIEQEGIYTKDKELETKCQALGLKAFGSYEELLEVCNAVYIGSVPELHESQIRAAIEKGRHVLCESPVTLSESECRQLFDLAEEKDVILMDAIKTAYATAYNRLHLLIKSGKIGEVVSIDTVCTSIQQVDPSDVEKYQQTWSSLTSWGPTAMLPILQILGDAFSSITSWTRYLDEETGFDAFTKMDFTYPHAVASLKVGKGIKSEGEMIISGTKGYVYVPAPWWKTDYFEIRFEDQTNNQRYFYQLDGEGIRYMLVNFVKSIQTRKRNTYLDHSTSIAICRVIEDHLNKKNTYII